MGKGGRIACIFTPMALTIASLVFLILVETGGWTKSSGNNNFYFFQANLTGLDVSKASSVANTTTLTEALALAQSENALEDIYQIHLWNYCTSNHTSQVISNCTKRENQFVFDPVEVWGLATINATATSTSSSSSAIQSAEAALKNNTEAIENELLGKAGADALATYRSIAKWLFIAYEVSFWTTVATIAAGLLAICSRWGSFLTWLFSIVSSIVTLVAVLGSTILFSILVGVLEGILHPYGIKLSVGTSSLVINWLAVLCSWAATLFWLFSVCCCSGRSNPHHRSNKGGLWNAEAKGQGYGGGYGGYDGESRGMKVERTGGGYQRVASPYVGTRGDEADHVPLQSYAAPMPYGGGHARDHSTGGFEPFRQEYGRV